MDISNLMGCTMSSTGNCNASPQAGGLIINASPNGFSLFGFQMNPMSQSMGNSPMSSMMMLLGMMLGIMMAVMKLFTGSMNKPDAADAKNCDPADSVDGSPNAVNPSDENEDAQTLADTGGINDKPLPPARPGSNRAKYEGTARAAARKYGIPENLFVRQIAAESGFNPNSHSGAGALGIAQFMPGTAKGMGINPLNPEEALDGAARLMGKHYQKYLHDGRLNPTGSPEIAYKLALAAYNAGPGNVNKYAGVPPFRETRNYVQKIMYA